MTGLVVCVCVWGGGGGGGLLLEFMHSDSFPMIRLFIRLNCLTPRLFAVVF